MAVVHVSKVKLERALKKPLKSGGHTSWSNGACVMEAVAYVAGEPWSDTPECVSPVLGAFMRSWNDGLRSNEDRDRLLKPFITRLVGTADDGHDIARSWMATDWQVRVSAPAWLDLAGLKEHAASLRGLPEITAATRETWDAPLKAARKDANAAWDAARAAARDAAGDAAWAAAWAAARDAARAAAWAAARDAARDALAPTVLALQDSALDLLERMVALGEDEREVIVNGKVA